MCVLELVTYHFFCPEISSSLGWDWEEFHHPRMRLGVWLQVFSLWDYRVFEPCTFMEGGMNHGHNPSFWLFECACCLFLDLVFCHGLSLICKESCCARTISSKCFRCVLLALLFWYRQLAALSWILSELFLCCFWLLFAHHYAEWNYTNWH